MIYVLFSGGIDSLACLVWAKESFNADIMPVHISYGSQYEEKEAAAVRIVLRDVYPDCWLLSIADLKEDIVTGHVPFRNTVFLTRVAMEPDCTGIVFGMLRGETSEDKNPKFIRRLEALLQSQLVRTVYSKKRDFAIYTPFATQTKTEVVAWLLSKGYNREVQQTVSCYGNTVRQCGKCQACFNRWVAFMLNGVPQSYVSDPGEYGLNWISAFLHKGSRALPGVASLRWWSRFRWNWEAAKALHRYCKVKYQGRGLIMTVLHLYNQQETKSV